jgi:hypothetical protein
MRVNMILYSTGRDGHTDLIADIAASAVMLLVWVLDYPRSAFRRVIVSDCTFGSIVDFLESAKAVAVEVGL